MYLVIIFTTLYLALGVAVCRGVIADLDKKGYEKDEGVYIIYALTALFCIFLWGAVAVWVLGKEGLVLFGKLVTPKK